ncbi:hypothetical protein [Microbacterium sp. NC79]|uniref:hypothetical protein n=1 Tax=Microbacterium sp. NC79 TaxID=2851009 RepID=UPI001C2CA9D0|nr:hypothetical protein [Microbacterium sp. NC79]MBV0893819.1 hypothetical protein [Microbacterium sp. NC79]
MKRRVSGILTLAATAALLTGCATTAATDAQETPAPKETAAIAASSFDAPVAFSESFGTADLSAQVWSALVNDETVAGALGAPEAGNVWVSATTATKAAATDLVDTDVAPVLRSTSDETASYIAVSPRETEIPLATAGQSYSFQWAFQVPEDKALAEDLVICLDDAEGNELGCSAIVK